MTEERANRKKSRFNVFRRRKNDAIDQRFEGKTIEATASERPLFQGQEYQTDDRQSSHRETREIQPNAVGNSPEDRPSHQETTERKGLVRALLGRGQRRGEVKETQSTRPVFAQRSPARNSSSITSNEEAQRAEEGDNVRFVTRGSAGTNTSQRPSDDLPQMPPLRRVPPQQAQNAEPTNPARSQAAAESVKGPMFTQRTRHVEAEPAAEGVSVRQPVSTPRQPVEPDKLRVEQQEKGQGLFRSRSRTSTSQSTPDQPSGLDRSSQSAANGADRPSFVTRPADQRPKASPPVAPPTAPRPEPLPRPEPGSMTGTRIPAQASEQPAAAVAKPNQTSANEAARGGTGRPPVPTSTPQQATAPKDSTAPKPPATSKTKALDGAGKLPSETSAKAKDGNATTAEDRPKVKPPMPPKKPIAPTPAVQTTASNPNDSNTNTLEHKPMSDLPNPSAATTLTPPSRLSPSGNVSLGIADQGQLIVGKDIKLNGKVQNCDVLIIEGTVEATLVNTKVLEVAEGGVFRGTAPVETAEISGLVEGDLIVDGHVLVRTTGVVNGNIEFGELEIERGGRVHGSMLQFGTAEQKKAAEAKKDSTPRASKKKTAKTASKKDAS